MPRILVADDSELDLHLTRRALKKALPDWEVLEVEDGEAAEKVLVEKEPALVLLDFKMPGMGAIDILEKLDAELPRRIAIVLFSSSVSPTDVARCEALGAREYVEKPTDPSEYAEAVAAICRRWA